MFLTAKDKAKTKRVADAFSKGGAGRLRSIAKEATSSSGASSPVSKAGMDRQNMRMDSDLSGVGSAASSVSLHAVPRTDTKSSVGQFKSMSVDLHGGDAVERTASNDSAAQVSLECKPFSHSTDLHGKDAREGMNPNDLFAQLTADPWISSEQNLFRSTFPSETLSRLLKRTRIILCLCAHAHVFEFFHACPDPVSVCLFAFVYLCWCFGCACIGMPVRACLAEGSKSHGEDQRDGAHRGFR